jgi:choice-of-anchor B domain-containing protein
MRCVRAVLSALAGLVFCALPGHAQSGSFGSAVVIHENELIVSEPNTNFRPGTVFIYRKNGNGWVESAQLRATDAERADGFGAALAVMGNTLFVAQRGGRLHLFRKEGTSWSAAGALQADGLTGLDPGCNQYGYCGTNFGITLATWGDWLLVGDPRSAPGAQSERRGRRAEAAEPSQAGVVHVFRRSTDGKWTEQALLAASDSSAGDAFGAAIVIADGRALIGAPGWRGRDASGAVNAGRVYEFRLEQDVWREAGPLESRSVANAVLGSSIALHGDHAVVGAPGAGDDHGAVFLYKRDGQSGTWTEQSRLAPYSSTRGHRFGSALAMNANAIWIGAPAGRGDETGAVYVYEIGTEATLDVPRRIRLTETVASDMFGDEIAAAGGVAAVAAAGADHQAGAVHVFEPGDANTWRAAHVLTSEPDALAPLSGEERKCEDGRVGPFDCKDVELLAFVPISKLRAEGSSRGVRTNDNWGWTDQETRREYAIVGRNDGTSFVDITDPVNPVLVGDLPKTPATPRTQLWRDMKVYKDHAFIVADGAGNHGMQVFDLRRLRDVTDAPALFEPDAHYDRVASVHNIAINQETGFAYLVGSRAGGETCGGGLHMVDIRKPLEPAFAGCFRHDSGTHDTQCVTYRGTDQSYAGREICLNSNGNSFAITDVTDKNAPREVARVTHPNPAYLHQGWLTADQRYFYMDDESDVIAGNVPTTRTLVWDLAKLEDPVLTTQFMGSMPASAHNLYIKDGFAYQANYRYGLHVLDVSDPENPHEVGFFDTSPHHEGPGFSGAWSTYPFFESGTILVTSLQEGLFLLKKRERTVF